MDSVSVDELVGELKRHPDKFDFQRARAKNAQFSTNWKGRLYIIDSNKSMIAEKIGIKVKGDYVIKV